MPDKPIWFSRLDEAIAQIQALPHPWVDRPTLEFVLGVGRRRAQQILQPLVRHTVGRSGLAPRDEVIEYLRQLAAGEAAVYEKRRRERLSSILGRLEQQPRVLVEAPTAIVNQALDNLPPGIRLEPGRILIEGFQTSEEAMRKMLALVMAMGNDPLGFDARISSPPRRT
jgi:hypothetical protein